MPTTVAMGIPSHTASATNIPTATTVLGTTAIATTAHTVVAVITGANDFAGDGAVLPSAPLAVPPLLPPGRVLLAAQMQAWQAPLPPWWCCRLCSGGALC